jgi:hypothetical protein
MQKTQKRNMEVPLQAANKLSLEFTEVIYMAIWVWRSVRQLSPSYHQDTGWLIITVSLWAVEVYQICAAYLAR